MYSYEHISKVLSVVMFPIHVNLHVDDHATYFESKNSTFKANDEITNK